MSRQLAIAYGFLVALAMVAVNVFPQYPFRSLYEHGRPLVYMTRETRMRGPLTVFYGFWPFGNPPVIDFHPLYLVIDILLALLFVAACIFAAHRLLIRDPIPITFRLSLWQLMCWITIFAVVLAIWGPLVLGFLLLQLPMLIVCCSFVVIFLAMVDRRKPRADA
jgi:hypothetical protein